MGGAVDSEVVDDVDEPKTSRSSTWILVDDVNTINKLEHRDRSYTGPLNDCMMTTFKQKT